jgi:hypothetical protein
MTSVKPFHPNDPGFQNPEGSQGTAKRTGKPPTKDAPKSPRYNKDEYTIFQNDNRQLVTRTNLTKEELAAAAVDAKALLWEVEADKEANKRAKIANNKEGKAFNAGGSRLNKTNRRRRKITHRRNKRHRKSTSHRSRKH